MASLYELTEDYKELLAMAEDEELDSELLADTLEGIEGSIEEKAEACAKIMKELAGESAAIQTEIDRLAKALCFDIMSVSPKQENAVREFGTYEYDKKSIEKGKEVPVKESDHCMDAIRYVVMGVWKRLKHWLPREVQDDKADILTKEVRDDEYL